MISHSSHISIAVDLKGKSRAVAKGMYLRLGIPSHVIVEAFRQNDIPISTKTVIKAVGQKHVRGFDPYHNKQTYHWTKFLGKYRRWAGKITAAIKAIMEAFWSWFSYSRMYGDFDLDAVLAGEKPP